jgi:hypothetical protein
VEKQAISLQKNPKVCRSFCRRGVDESTVAGTPLAALTLLHEQSAAMGRSEMSGSARRNPRLDAISRYIAATWLGILLLAVAIIIAVRLLAMAFPSMLDGLDVLEAGRTPNYFRNVFELLSFVGAFLVGMTAIFALLFAMSQIKEARNTRLAALYATLEARWASPEMLRSKAMLNEISTEYEKQLGINVLPATVLASIQSFADHYMCELGRIDYGKYSSAISLVEYFEYIGMLEKSGYMDIDDMQYLFGTVSIEVYSIMYVHIERLRLSEYDRNQRKGFNAAPKTFECFADLVEKYSQKFKAP